MVGMVAKILFGNGAGLWKPDLGISNTRECVDLNFYRRGQEPRLTVHLLIVYSLPAEALVSTSFKAQNLIRSWLKKKKKDQKKKFSVTTEDILCIGWVLNDIGILLTSSGAKVV